MNLADWQSFYQSELQGVYSLLLVPIAFLAYRAVARPEASRAVVPAATHFVAGLTLFFAIETLIDPISTGPLLKHTGLGETFAATLIPFLFVFLGDLRVLLLLIGVARIERGFERNLAWAAGMTLVVPISAGSAYAALRWLVPDAHGQLLWIFYEFGFLILCIGLGRVWVPGNCPGAPAKAAFLRSILGYSAAYYALWLVADLLIVGGGLDLGWALRIVPNQLYYAFWVPFVYWRFFSVHAPNAER
jgi:hypothetical protein